MDFKKIKGIFSSYKALFLFLIAEIILIALFLPHNREMVDFPKYSDKQKTVRLDMYNYGSKTNTIKISGLSDKNAKVSTPEWMLSDKGHGTMITSMSQNERLEGTLDFTAEPNGDGTFVLQVRGMDVRDKSDSTRRLPVCIKINKLTVNGQDLLKAPKVVWHDSAFKYQCDAKNGDKLRIHIEWEPFNGE